MTRPSVDQRQKPAFAAGQRWSTPRPSGRIAAQSPCRAIGGRDCRGAAGDRHRAGLPVALSGMPERGAFGAGESCHRYSPRLGGRNAEIADLLIALTNARKTWRFSLCFLYLRNVQVIPS